MEITYIVSIWLDYTKTNILTARDVHDIAIYLKILGKRRYKPYAGGEIQRITPERAEISELPTLEAAYEAASQLRQDGIQSKLRIYKQIANGRDVRQEEVERIPAIGD